MADCECLRCGHKWGSRKEHPKKCPGCQNPHWDQPKTRRRRGLVVSSPRVMKSVGEAVEAVQPTTSQTEPVNLSRRVTGSGDLCSVGSPQFDRIKQARERAEKLLEGIL